MWSPSLVEQVRVPLSLKLVVATRRPLQLATSIADGIMDGGVAMNSGGVVGFVCCVVPWGLGEGYSSTSAVRASAAGDRGEIVQAQCHRGSGCDTGVIRVSRHEPAALVRQKPYIRRAGHLRSSFFTSHQFISSPLLSLPNPCAMDQPRPLVIRLHPNAVAHERQDGVWFQSTSPVVFQHADISTMAELQAVFLYHLGGEFTEIRKVGYCYLQQQPDGRFQHLLVWSAASRLACRLRRHRFGLLNPPPETEAAMGHSESEEDNSDYATSIASSSDAQEGGAGGPETRSASCPRHVFPAPPPIPRVEDVPCYFQQLDLDEGASSDPLNAGIGNDYNTDGG
ncbi:hypothetical protein PIB30_052289 [Stylosanthes scabra]|uniref:Uncharacterized protein n=1 Tax=Stylosanthes scabra TaxID=79078 RepID=A0ABU6QHY8_9FABA|nr:hypothetical protein [Stylosanthes scabra]